MLAAVEGQFCGDTCGGGEKKRRQKKKKRSDPSMSAGCGSSGGHNRKAMSCGCRIVSLQCAFLQSSYSFSLFLFFCFFRGGGGGGGGSSFATAKSARKGKKEMAPVLQRQI